MQKRSSLTHTPDVVRMLQKLEQQQVSETHEFQKVSCGCEFLLVTNRSGAWIHEGVKGTN